MGWVDAILVGMMVAFGVALWRIDVREHRLPDRLTLSLFALEFAFLLLAAATFDAWPRFGTAVIGAAAMAALYAALMMLPGGVGFGDVKLALSIGLVSAWWGWDCWVLALFAAFMCGGLVAVWMWVRGAGLRTHFAFGPAMLLGWALAATASLTALA